MLSSLTNKLGLSKLARAGFVAGAALALTACGGEASSSADAGDAAPEKIDNTVTGALADMTQGSPDAAVTVIEFASTTCSHCATFHETVYPTIEEKYIDTGLVRFVFREFPTAPAELSVAASMLARCAADKGGPDAYFTVIKTLFKTQRTWIFGDNPREELLKIVAQAGMDEAAFDSCVKRQELVDLITTNVEEGQSRYNITSTPSFVINGQKRHFSSAEEMSKALDEALEKASE